jgi:hypothetical protein
MGVEIVKNRILRVPGFIVGIAAFGIGTATASLVGEISFNRVDLYGAMAQIHKLPKANVLFPCGTGPTLTFKTGNDSTGDMIRTAARQYGKDAVMVNGVFVLEDPLPTDKTGIDRLRAAEEWARANLPESSRDGSGRSVDALRAFSDDVESRARNLSTARRAGAVSFGSLSPSDQATVVYLLRTQKTATAACMLSSVFKELN